MKSGVYVPPGRRNLVSKPADTTTIEKKEREPQDLPDLSKHNDETNEKSSLTSSGERFYVPPWRRNEGKTTSLEDKDMKAFKEMRVDDTYTPPDWTELDHEFKDNISDEKLLSCSGVIINYSSTAPDLVRENELKPYLKYGCEYRWIDRQTCLLVFLNEANLQRAFNNTIGNQYRPIALSQYCNRFPGSEILADARKLYSKIKPERDSKVANRLINHALGLRAPRRAQSQASSQANKQSVAPAEETTTTTDAWDD